MLAIDEIFLDPSVRWVVAYVGAWKPKEVTDYLERVGYAPYCPYEQRVVYRSGAGGSKGRKVVTRPLFGGYLFVGQTKFVNGVCQPLSPDTHPRIFDILGDSLGPFHVRPETLQAIRSLELAGEWDYSRSLAERFPVGKRVLVKRGHFAEFEAIVAKVEASGKLKLNLRMFGRRVEATVAPGMVAIEEL